MSHSTASPNRFPDFWAPPAADQLATRSIDAQRVARLTGRRQRPGTTLMAIAVAVLLTVLLAGCGTTPAETGAADTNATVPTVSATPVDPNVTTEEPSTAPHHPAVIARASGELPVYAKPNKAAPSRTLPATTVFGTPTVVLVSKVGTGAREGWLKVVLPVRPNGSTGWIRSADVELRDIAIEVEIDLDARRLVVTDGDQELLSTTTAIGAPEHPTPTGRFYVVDKLQTPNPDGAYGPFALGLSARSDVLTEFAGGDGQIGIHGTDTPSSIGDAVSRGCIRVDNEVITELAELLPLGAPVTIL